MPVHIENMTSEVTAVDGDLPLTPQQIEKLVKVVLERLEKVERESKRDREATTIRTQAAPSE